MHHFGLSRCCSISGDVVEAGLDAVVQALLLGFSLSELAFGVLVASVFSRAKIAAIVGPLLHFCLLLPRWEPGHARSCYVFGHQFQPKPVLSKTCVRPSALFVSG